jgi:stage II sporulation protein D
MKTAPLKTILTGLLAGALTCAVFAIACAPKAARGAGNGPLATASRTQNKRNAHSFTPASVGVARATASDSLRSGAVNGAREGRLSRDRVALIALAGGARKASISSDGSWQIFEQGGRVSLVRGNGGEPWRVEQKGPLLRIAGEGDDATPWREGPFIVQTESNESLLSYNGKRYRGELWLTATDSGILVVNRIEVEDYLKGVVPLELGTRNETDRAALEAQAIAARSYTYARVPSGELQMPRNGWHMVATVNNQVYGGFDAENRAASEAVDGTAGLVLRYDGLLIDAPYYSSCGGRTASPREAWTDARDEPYLQPVSDINPATGKSWCDGAPHEQWSVEFDQDKLEEVTRRAFAAAGARNVSATVQDIKVQDRTASGRVGSMVLRTNRGDLTLSASDIRSVFRDARGAILSSTYFSVDRVSRERGQLVGVTLRGVGYGHGVGMCQWGAINRARAGQGSREILKHYYPGTVVGFAD